MLLAIQVGPDTSDGLLVPVGQMSSDVVPFGEMGLESWLRVSEGMGGGRAGRLCRGSGFFRGSRSER